MRLGSALTATTQPAISTPLAIRRAAVRLFVERGYEATTMRQLAREVGIEAASLYNHVPSKQQLLAEILIDSMQELLSMVRDAVEAAGPEPANQLRDGIRAYVFFHESRLGEALISDTERRSLESPSAERLYAMRDELGSIFKGIIRRGGRKNVFRAPDVSMAALSILSICARLPVWYKPGGRLTLEQVADRFAEFALLGLGANPPAPGSRA